MTPQQINTYSAMLAEGIVLELNEQYKLHIKKQKIIHKGEFHLLGSNFLIHNIRYINEIETAIGYSMIIGVQSPVFYHIDITWKTAEEAEQDNTINRGQLKELIRINT